MFGIRHLKSDPSHYVIHFQNGRARRAGIGLSFFYYQPTSAIAIVPVGSADVPFIFNEATADFQPVTVQGQLTYRIVEPERVASLLNYTVDGAGKQYLTDDPEKLAQRLINLAQVLTRAEIGARSLREAIRASDEIVSAVTLQLASSESLAAIGVEVLDFSILAIKPSPEIARALEAEAREMLLREADLAIYDRRNAAVEQERRIKENELNTEIAVESKKRQIRETQAEANLAVERKEQALRETRLEGQVLLENGRRKLVAAQVENAQAEADAQAYAIEASLRPLQTLEPSLLELLAVQSTEPKLMVSMALKEIAQNAAKIGQLNITPDLLDSLLQR